MVSCGELFSVFKGHFQFRFFSQFTYTERRLLCDSVSVRKKVRFSDRSCSSTSFLVYLQYGYSLNFMEHQN